MTILGKKSGPKPLGVEAVLPRILWIRLKKRFGRFGAQSVEPDSSVFV